MQFSLSNSITLLERTPGVLKTLLLNLSDEWVHQNEGPQTFSPFDVLGHLIHGERTDWVVRAKIILTDGVKTPFTPYDRFAQYTESKDKKMKQLLEEFEEKRRENIQWLKSINLSVTDLELEGMHPALGKVTLQNLLAAWVAHDLTHIAQITRVLAKQYKDAMGPWLPYFRILND